MFGAEQTIYFKYMISKLEITMPNLEPIQLDYTNIGGIIVEKDYDNDIHPVMEIKLALHPLDIFNILDNKNSVRFNIRMDKFAYKTGTNLRYSFKDISFNETFAIYLDDNTVQLDKELFKRTQNIKQTQTDVQDMRFVYSFFLFKEKDIDIVRTMNNNVITRCTMTDAITYLLSKAKCRNVLMSPLENQKYYDEVVLFPVTLYDNIKRLEERCGFYKHGTTFFLDISRTYFVNKRGLSTAHSRGEFTNVMIYVYKANNNVSLQGGFEKDVKTKTYNINVLTSSINMKTSGTLMNEIDGTNIVMIDSLNDTYQEIEPDTNHRGHTTTRVIDKLDISHDTNEFVESEAKARIEEANSILEVSFVGVDIDIFTPNKRFTFVFEDTVNQKKIGGVYRLAKAYSAFMPKGTSMNIVSDCVFYKIK